MDWVGVGVVIVALVLGALAGAAVAVRVRSGSHRRAGESGRPTPRTLWVVAAVAFGCAWLTWRLAGAPWPILLLWLPLVPALVALAAIDLDVRRLPDSLLLPVAGWVALCLVLLVVAQQRPAGLVVPVIAAALCGGTFWALHLASRGALGLGDVKLVAILGAAVAAVAWQFVVWALLVACAAALLAAAVTRRRELAFGPWLALGAVVAAGLPH